MIYAKTTEKASKHFFEHYASRQFKPDTYANVIAAVYSRKHKSFQDIINTLSAKVFLGDKEIPLMQVSPSNHEEIIIYPNIKVSHYRAPFYNVQRQLDTITKEMNDPKKKKRWELQSRGIKFLLKREKMNIYTALRRHLKLHEHGYKDDQIRDIGLYLIGRFAPPNVVFCNTPDDYVTLFKTPTGSCMQWRDNLTNRCHHGPTVGALWEQLKNKFNAFPSVWYHYCPELQGVYAADTEGKPQARAFIYNDGKHHGGIYGAYAPQLQGYFDKKGTKSLPSGYFTITQDFKVPAYNLNNEAYMPLPHMDDILKNFYVRYLKSSNEFEVSPKKLEKGIIILDNYRFCGYVKGSQCSF